jgi:hypothetical protein
VQHILALSGSAVTIRHWFEINLNDASMEHGARIEIRELTPHPRRGSESASQLTTVDRPLWRADLFDRLADPPGSFSAAHYHPQFKGNEPCPRSWDAALTADPWAWLGNQITSLGTAAGGAAWPLDPEDAAELPGLAGAVVSTAQQFGPSECRSAAECFQLTRDVEEAVQLMIATLRAPDRLDRDRAAPWLGRPLRQPLRAASAGAQMMAQPIEHGRGNQGDRGDRDRGRKAQNLSDQLEQSRADRADHDRSGHVGQSPPTQVARLGAYAGQASEPCRLRVLLDDDGSHYALPGYRLD